MPMVTELPMPIEILLCLIMPQACRRLEPFESPTVVRQVWKSATVGAREFVLRIAIAPRGRFLKPEQPPLYIRQRTDPM